MEYRRPLTSDFEKMVTLQNKNLKSALNQSENLDGFLTASFSAEEFKSMDNDLCVIVCADGQNIVAYACASSIEYNKNFPLIATMIKQFPQIIYKNKPLVSYNSFIYGPACIDREYRGKGVLNNIFSKMRDFLLQEHQQFELLTTIISVENERSIKAHEKLGMKSVGQFEFNENTFWILALPINRTSAI